MTAYSTTHRKCSRCYHVYQSHQPCCDKCRNPEFELIELPEEREEIAALAASLNAVDWDAMARDQLCAVAEIVEDVSDWRERLWREETTVKKGELF